MGVMFYKSCRAGGRFIAWQTMRHTVLDAERAHRPGAFILAPTHVSHLEPFIVSAVVERQIRWMARIEFYKQRWAASILKRGGAFPVDRYGRTSPAVRTAVSLVKAGECIGVFPEGGVAQGSQSILRGAPFKQGVCTIAVETRVPIVPVVVVGSHHLNKVGPWLPFRRGQLWTAFGNDILPPERSPSRRADRKEMAARLQAEYIRTYHDLLKRCNLTDADVP